MATSYSVQLLSGTPANGRVIPVAATATPGTLIHTAITGTSGFDEVYLYATNVSASAVALTIEWGGVTTGDHLVKSYVIPANSGLVLVAPGLRINNALVIRAFAGTANVIHISGNVNRIQ